MESQRSRLRREGKLVITNPSTEDLKREIEVKLENLSGNVTGLIELAYLRGLQEGQKIEKLIRKSKRKKS